MDVFLKLAFVLQSIFDTVCGVYLCNSEPTSWKDGIYRCLTENGRPLSFNEVIGVNLTSTDQVWTADFFELSFSGPNELCQFVYRDLDGNDNSLDVFFCDCAETRKYLCRDNNSDSLIILNGNWTSAIDCGTFIQSEIQNVTWTEGYFWVGSATYRGNLGQVTNWTAFNESISNLLCGMYEDDVRSYFRECDHRSICLCYFETFPNNYFNKSCYNLETTATTTKPPTSSVFITQTIIPTTSASGNPVSSDRETSQSPVTEIFQRYSSPTGTTAVENAHRDNPIETKHTAAGAGVGLSLALIGAIVAVILIQRRYGCIRCLKSLQYKQFTGNNFVHANPAYDVTDDLRVAESNTKTKAQSFIERSKYENLKLASTKDPQDMLSNAQTSEYSFALDVNGPGNTESKVGEYSYKENEYDSTQHVCNVPSKDKNVYSRTYALGLEENVNKKQMVLAFPRMCTTK